MKVKKLQDLMKYPLGYGRQGNLTTHIFGYATPYI